MADQPLKEEEKAEEPRPLNITFRCQRCGKERPLADMRSVTRFNPVMIVCKYCQKEML
jgi:transcription elongation factor Elf1